MFAMALVLKADMKPSSQVQGRRIRAAAAAASGVAAEQAKPAVKKEPFMTSLQ
jgi:hypothetical protein